MDRQMGPRWTAAIVAIALLAPFMAQAAPMTTGPEPQASPHRAKPAGDASPIVIDYAGARRSAEAIVAFAVEMRDPAILIGAIRVLLRSGARLDADDPWRPLPLLELAETLARGEPALLAAIADLRGSTRGVLDGPIRSDLTLAPGETASVELLAAAGEFVDLEARLKSGSVDADLDVVVRDGSGAVVAEETGPESGRLGVGVYVGWITEVCARYRVEVINKGATVASFALLTSRAVTTECE